MRTCNRPGGGLLTTLPFCLFSSNEITNASGASILGFKLDRILVIKKKRAILQKYKDFNLNV